MSHSGGDNDSGDPYERQAADTMYEMYPDAWPDAHPDRTAQDASGKPRRRTRKEHSVVPPVIAHQQHAGKHEARESH